MALLSAHTTTIQPQVTWPKPFAASQKYAYDFSTPPTVTPAVTVYSESFATSTGALVAGTSVALYRDTFTYNSAPAGLYFDASVTGARMATIPVSGLTVGRSYTFTGKVYKSSTTTWTASLGVTGIGSSTATVIAASTWGNRSYTFTATATSHTLEIRVNLTSGTGNVYWDDFVLTQDTITDYTPTNDGWVATNSSLYTGTFYGTPAPGGGTVSANVTTTPAQTGQFSIKRTVTGLTSGRSYTVTANALVNDFGSGVSNAKIGVTGIGYGTALTPAVWTGLSYTFTATATSHEVLLEATATGATNHQALWDDIRVTENAGTTPTLVDPLAVIDGAVTMDETRVPYIQVRSTVALPPAAQRAVIDPRNAIRATVTLTQTFADWNAFGYRAPVTRTFDLSLRDFVVDVNKGTVDVLLWGDEAALQNYGLVAGAPERTYGLSVKTAVSYALAKVGATLAAGASDATLTSKTLEAVRTNLVTNPGAEVNTTGWNIFSGATIARSTVQKRTGTASFAITRTGTGDDFAYFVFAGLVVGRKYTVSAWVYKTANGATGSSRGMFSDATSENAPYGTNLNVWERISYVFTATSTTNQVRFYAITGATLYVDDVLCTEGTDLIPHFDGSTVGGNDAGLYTVAWTGTAHASTSTLTNLPNTDATIWQPGQTAWDYITPLLQIGNLRLYCDETRAWRLEPAGNTRDGLVLIGSAQNVTEAQDSISLSDTDDGKPLWYTGVVIAYTGNVNATTGQKFTTYDTAGTGSRVLNLSYDRPQPGTGAAANVLARAAGRGRAFALEAMSDYSVTPGQTLAATLPDVPLQTGYVSAVTWGLPAARMTVKSRALIDTPANSWVLAPGTWAAQTKTWATYP